MKKMPMTETQMSYNDFFRQFIVKLCSSLDLPKATYQCSLLIKELIPFEELILSIITDDPHKLRHLVAVESEETLLIEETTDIPVDVYSYIRDHFNQNDIKFMRSPESFIVMMPLIYKSKPIGFFTIVIDKELPQDQMSLLTTLQESITRAIAAALSYEDEDKRQAESFSVSVEVIFNRLKALMEIDTDKELARNLNTIPSVISNSKIRSSIPYDKIIQYCQREKIPLDIIFMHYPVILTKQEEGGLYKAVLPSGIEYIDDEKVEELLKLPAGSLNTYAETCLFTRKAFPPIEKLSLELLQRFHDALRYKQVYGRSTPSKLSTIVIPFAAGAILKDKEIATTGHFFNFCKEWAESISATVNVFAYRIADDNMEPTLINNDVVIINPNLKNLKSGGLYAVSIADNIAVRRLLPTGGGKVTMICDNKIYPTDTVSSEDIIGKIIWYARNI